MTMRKPWKPIIICPLFLLLVSAPGLSQSKAADHRASPVPLYFQQLTSDPSGLGEYYSLYNFFEDRDSFLWFLGDKGMHRYDGHGLMSVLSDPVDLNSLSSNRVKDVFQDEHGVYWITTRSGGLNAYDPAAGRFTHYRHDAADPTTLSTDDLFFIEQDEEGMLWIGSTLGMNRFDPRTGKNTRITPRPGRAGELQGHPWSPIIADGGRIYVCTTAGFEYYDRRTNRWHFFPVLDERGDTITIDAGKTFTTSPTICRDQGGRLWIGMLNQAGLWTFDPGTDRLTPVRLRSADGQTIAIPRSILEDRSGRLWILDDDHIWRIPPDRQTLERCVIIDAESRQRKQGFRNLYQDHSGLVWIKSNSYHHPYYFDLTQAAVKTATLPGINDREAKLEHLLFDSSGLVWIATSIGLMRLASADGEAELLLPEPNCHHVNRLGEDHLLVCSERGLLIVDKQNGRSRPVRMGSGLEPGPPWVICSTFDHDGDLWFSTWGAGLFRIPKGALNVQTGVVTSFEQWKYDPSDTNSLPSNLLQGIAVGPDNKVWVCGGENGLNSVDKTSGRVQRFMYRQGNAHGISSNYTYALEIDRGGDIWVTFGGWQIERFSPSSGIFKKYGALQGLPDRHMSEITLDASGNLWINQTQTVCRIDPATDAITIFPQVADKAVINETIAVHPRTGEVYFGSHHELHVFDPKQFNNQSKNDFPLCVSEVLLYEKGAGAMRPIPQQRWKNTTLRLSHRENFLEIRFALLDYRHPTLHEYAYALYKAGEQPQWISTGDKNAVSLTNMAPGTYLLSLRGRNSYGVWTDRAAALRIHVLPPWWASWWAYGGYLLLLGAAVWALYRYQLRQQLRQQLAQQETLRLRELDDFKTRFFTNVTHEFRTPLTVMLGTTEQLLTVDGLEMGSGKVEGGSGKVEGGSGKAEGGRMVDGG